MVHEDFEEQDYALHGSVSSSQSESVDIIMARVNANSCSQDDCPTGPNPADQAWIELMTAIPKIESVDMEYRSMISDCPMPADHVMDEIINTLRPYNAEQHSIEAVKDEWHEKIFLVLPEIAGRLQSRLKDLADNWVGQDFDAYSEHVGQMVKALNVTTDNVENLISELQDQEDTIFHLQGGSTGEVPFPGPQYFDADKGKDDVSVHVRPPFWDQGDCIIKTNEEALAMTGADEDAPNDFHQREEERIEEIIEERLEAMTPQEREVQNLGELENEAQQQARDEIQPDIDAYKQEVHNGQLGESERLTQEVMDNRDQADSTLAAAKFTVDPAEIEHQDFTEQANGPTYGGLTSPPGPAGSPNLAGMTEPGGHTPGTSPSLADVEAARSGGYSSNVWDTGADEDDENSDGLFSGTSGGGGGVSTATSPSAAATPGGGAGGAVGGAGVVPGGRGGTATNPAGGSRGPGSGAGAGRGSGPGGSGGARGGGGGRPGGAMPAMVGGSPNAGGQGQNQNNAKSGPNRNNSAIGRPTPGTTAAVGGQAATGAKEADKKKEEKKPTKYSSRLAAQLEQRQAERDAKNNPPAPEEPEELDFHDEYDIEEDYWGAHQARKDEYR